MGYWEDPFHENRNRVYKRAAEIAEDKAMPNKEGRPGQRRQFAAH